ncbi:MAG: AraC family transcriptional regulator ligand-binding domain-containing protein [Flavobacteriales bacterium]|nr:AraC family transcriptional regulator ligand-binding domain-containing protein [Flavobacteriales bacterium]
MTDRFRIGSELGRRLKEQRIALDPLLRQAGLSPSFFEQEKITVSTAELFALWRAVGEISVDPSIGITMGSDMRVERLQPTAIAAVCSRTFGDAVERMGRYKQLVCPEHIHLHREGADTAVEFVFTEATENEPDVLVDNCLAWIFAIGRRGTEGRLSAVRLDLRRGMKHRDMLEKHFGCRVKFKAERNALIFRTVDLALPFTTHNAELLALVGAQLDSELAAKKLPVDIATRVKQVLQRSLAGKRPSLKDVAGELGLSPRSLQRKLADEEITFQYVVEGTRRELAHHYLSQAMELNETAYLLGYEDANSFFRAFNSWEGVTPGEWRMQHRAVA